MEPLTVLSGKKVDQKQWQKIKAQYILGREKQIDKARFQQKKKQFSEYGQVLEQIKDPRSRTYTRSVLLKKIDDYYRIPFFQSRVRLPRINRNTIDAFAQDIRSQDPRTMHVLHHSEQGKDYQVYVLRTPARPSKDCFYPRDTVLQVTVLNDAILEVREVSTRI